MQIMYGNVVLSSYNIFQDQTSLCFENAPFFHFMLVLLFIFVVCRNKGAFLFSGKLESLVSNCILSSRNIKSCGQQ